MSTPAVRDLRWVSDRDQADLLSTFGRAWANWVADCLPPQHTWAPAFELQQVAEAALPLPDGPWQAHGEQGASGPAGWSQWSERGRQQLAARLVQRAASAAALPEHDWALAAADLAWAKLNEQLLGPLMPCTDEALAKPDARAWSGIVFISEPLLGAHWAWRLPPHEPTASSVGDIQRSVLDCVAQRSLRLQAELGEVDITLADLLALQVGDVVRFPAAHGQGVPFRLGETTRIAGHGQLGLIEGRLALRLSSPSSVRS